MKDFCVYVADAKPKKLLLEFDFAIWYIPTKTQDQKIELFLAWNVNFKPRSSVFLRIQFQNQMLDHVSYLVIILSVQWI